MSPSSESRSFEDYLNQRLTDRLTRRKVVVWYDPGREFVPFVDQLMTVELPRSQGTSRVQIGDMVVDLAQFEGSLFGLRAAVEPLVEDEPEPLLIYLPGVEHDLTGSVLMELERAGDCYKPQLRQLARSALRRFTTDGEIDALLGDRRVTFDDVVGLFDQHGGGERASMLKVIFGGARSEAILARWLAEEELDTQIDAKDAQHELCSLVTARLGLELDPGMELGRARARTLRFVLAGEFRSDLGCDPPASLGSIPVPARDHLARALEVARLMRVRHPEAYVALADRVEGELGLAGEGIDAAHLGKIDTFRFEERLLLRWCGSLIRDKKYDEALVVVQQRRRSFWVDRDVDRQAQWEVSRLMAELGLTINDVAPRLGKVGKDPAAWVDGYTAEDGWYRVDLGFRSLQAWESRMACEPEDDVALRLIRQRYEALARAMAEGFSGALQSGGWAIDGVLAQQEVFPRVVDSGGGRVAYFLVDAMRFEMGVELARRLNNVSDLHLQPAVAALPTITPVGMAALLPGASESFSVVEEGGKIASCIEGTALPQLGARMSFLRSRVPGAVDLTLNRVFEYSAKRLARELGSAPLVVVRSQEVDALGEMVEGWTARQVMDTVLGNIARAAHKLAGLGIERFVVAADHGHLFGSRKEEDMCTDAPGGDTVSAHRRCWIGRGGKTPPGTVRVSGAQLGYSGTDLEFVFPVGLGVFRAHGGLSFHHGGLSLQEVLVPVVSFRITARGEAADTGVDVVLEECPDAITNRAISIKLSVKPRDLFAQEEPLPLRVVGLSDRGDQVARALMAQDAEFDSLSGVAMVAPKTTATVGLLLTQDEGYKTVEIVVQNVETDAELRRSAPLKLKLGI